VQEKTHTMKIDPRKNRALAEKRLDTETDPICKRNLALVLAHMKAEATLDLEGLLATVAENAKYHFFGSENNAAFSGPKGKANIEAFYKMIVETGLYRIEHDINRVVVDRCCVITEGNMHIAYPGSLLQAMGYPVDDSDELYMYETQQLIVWPIDDAGLIAGEDSYSGEDGFIGIEGRQLKAGDIYSFD
tara:strand:- start:2734 stop:3300 length:567 start_codon:yes stop_codon:yes gene_type:complete